MTQTSTGVAKIATRTAPIPNVLIDTCSWAKLLYEPSLLDYLEYWTENGHIALYTHEQINQEWPKTRDTHRKDAVKKAKEDYEGYRRHLTRMEVPDIGKPMLPPEANIDSAIKRVERLLSMSTELRCSNEILLYCVARHKMTPRKNPFLAKKGGGMYDGYIIYAAIEHFLERSTQFIFISENVSDFAAEDNDELIHPDIIEDYPTVQLTYFRFIGKAINEFKHFLPLPPIEQKHLGSKSISFIEITTASVSNIIDNWAEKSIVDQLFEYLTLRHKGINYFPPRLLISMPPFSKKPGDSEYGLFTAFTDNTDVITFLAAAAKVPQDEWTNQLSELYPETRDIARKAESICKYLSNALINTVSDHRSRIQTDVPSVEAQSFCTCIRCNFRRFELNDALAKLSDPPEKAIDHITIGYINFCVGNYKRSTDSLRHALARSKEDNEPTLAYLATYNLHNLWRYVRTNYPSDIDATQMAETLRLISVDGARDLYTRPENADLLRWMTSNDFYTEARDRIYKSHFKLIDHYFNQLNGAWNSNNHIRLIINEYGSLETFINGNFILYDQFLEFNELADKFFESLFIAYAMNKNAGSRLDEFNDWMLNQMLRYGKAENISKYYNRYKLDPVKYRQEPSDQQIFVTCIKNILSDPQINLKVDTELGVEQNYEFHSLLNKYIANAVVLMSIVDLKPATLSTLVNQLVSFLNDESFLLPNSLRFIGTLINRKHNSIKTEALTAFFQLFVCNPKYANNFSMDAICDKLTERRFRFKSDDKILPHIMSYILKRGEANEIVEISDNIGILYNLLPNAYRNELKFEVANYLKRQFNFSIFYTATITNIIPYDSKLLAKAIEFVQPKQHRTTFKKQFVEEADDTYPAIGDLLNLCFMYGVDTKATVFKPLYGISEYYDWLLDMNGYNYEKFNPEWISHYTTRFYFRKIFLNNKVKLYLECILRDKKNTKTESLYYNIYVRQPWNIRKESNIAVIRWLRMAFQRTLRLAQYALVAKSNIKLNDNV